MNQKKFNEAFDYAFKDDFYSRTEREIIKTRLKSFDINTSKKSKQEVKKFLYDDIWKNLLLGEIEFSNVRNKSFEFSVEFGVKKTSIFIQRTLNSGWNKNLIVDGNVTKKEVNMINNIEKEEIFEKILCHHVISFCEIFAKNKNINFIMKWVFR